MATELNNMYLASGGTLALAFGTSATKVYGSVDADKITIAAGVTVVLDGSFNRGNDTIQFTGNAASYSVVRVNASTVRVTDASGTSVTIPVGSAGTAIQFADATRTLSGSSAGLVLGDQSITSTATALTAGAAPVPVEAYTLSVTSPSVTEGDTGSKTLSYKLTLDKAPTSTVTVSYETLETGTATANDDFVPAAGTVTFAAGQTVAFVSVTVLGDATVEAPETIKLNLSGSKLVASVQATGTIVDNDLANLPVTYNLTGSNAVNEGNSASFALKTTGLAAGTTVGYKLVGTGSAASQSATGTFTVDSDGNATVSVPVASNNTVADTGSLTIELLNGKAAPITATVIDGTPTAYGAAAITTTNTGSGVQSINVAGTAAQSLTLDTDQVTATNGFVINSASAAVTVTSGSSNDKITLTGNGNNTIVTGAGNDTVTISGTGNNTIRVGSGNDTVTAGSGNDTIYVDAGALNGNDTFDGGAGNDTLVIAGNGNVITAANVKNIENIVLDGTTVTVQDLAALANIKSISGSTTTSDVTINVAAADVIDLTGLALSTIKSLTLAGAGTVTLKADASDLANSAAILVTGGATVNLVTDAAGYKALSAADTGINGSKTVSDTAQNLIANKAALSGATALAVTGTVGLADAAALASAGVAASKTVSMSVSDLLNAAKYPDQLAALKVAGTKIQVTGVATAAQATALLGSYGAEIAAYQSAATGNLGVAISDNAANIVVNFSAANDARVSSVAFTAGAGVSVANAVTLAGLTASKVSGTYAVSDTAANINNAITTNTLPASLAKASTVTLTTAAGDRVVNSTANALELKLLGSKLVGGYDVALTKGGTENGLVTATSTNILMPNTTGFEVGAAVTGTGIPAGTTIVSINPNNNIVLSAAATASGASVAITAAPMPLSTNDLSAVASAVSATLSKSTAFSVTELNTILAQNTTATVNKVSDTASNLAGVTANLAAVTADISVTTAATVAEATQINSALTTLFAKPGNHTISNASGVYTNSFTIADTKANVLAGGSSAIVKGAEAVSVSDAMTLAEAQSLKALADVSGADRLASGGLSYTVSDSASALAAALSATNNSLAVAALAGAAANGVTATGTATVAEAKILGTAYTSNSVSAVQVDAYKIADTVAKLFPSGTLSADIDNVGDAAMAKATTLSVIGNVTVAQLGTLKGIQNASSTTIFDNKYAISDTAAAVATAAGSVLADLKAATSITVGTAAVADLAGLKTLNDALALDGKSLVSFALTDSIASITGSSALGSATPAVVSFVKTATSIKATGDASTITLAALDTLATRAGSTAYTVDLTDTSNAISGLGAGILSNANVTKLALTGTAISGTTTSGSAIVTVASTAGLVAGATVTGTGIPAGTTIANITDGTTLVLSANATASGSPSLLTSLNVAGAKSTIANVGASAAAKLSYDLVDSYANLVAAADQSVVLNGVNLTPTGSLTALQAATLAGLTGSAGAVNYNIVDSYANLVAQAGSVADGAKSINVSNSTLTVAQYTELLARANATTTVNTTVTAEAISDTAANVSGASAAVLAATSGVTLTDNGSLTVSLAQARALAAGGTSYAKIAAQAGQPAAGAVEVKVVDTIANLLAAVNNGSPTATDGFILAGGSYKVVASDTASLTVAQATNLTSISDLVASFNITDTGSALAGFGANLSKAQGITATGQTTLTDAQTIFTNNKNVQFAEVTGTAAGAGSIGAFTGSGATKVYTNATLLAKASVVTISAPAALADIAEAKAAAGSVAVKYDLTDTANLLSKASVADLAGATTIAVTGAAAKGAEAAVLAGYAAKFTTSVAVSDTAANLVTNVAAIKAIATGTGAVTLSGSASASQYSTLKTELGTKLTAGGITDTAAAIADYLASGATAGTYTLTSDKLVSASQAKTLVDNSLASGLTVQDTAANLIALNNTAQTSYKVLGGAIELSVAKDLAGVFTGSSINKVDFTIATTAERFNSAYSFDTDGNAGNGTQLDTTALTAMQRATSLTVDGVTVKLGSKDASLTAGNRSTFNGKIIGTVDEINALPASIKAAAGYVIVDSVANVTNAANAGLIAASVGYVITDTAANILAASSSVLSSGQKALGVQVTGTASVADINAIFGKTDTDTVSSVNAVKYSLSDSATALAADTSAVTQATNVTVTGTANATQAGTILAANGAASVNVVDTGANLVDTSKISLVNLGKVASIVADANTATAGVIDPISLTDANTLVRGKGATASLTFNVDATAANIATAVGNVSGSGADAATLRAAGVITVTGGVAGTAATAAEAKALATVTVTGGYAVSGASADLTDPTIVGLADLAKATVVKASTAATVAQATTLTGLTNFEKGAVNTADAGKNVLSITDSALNIAKSGSASLFDSLTGGSVITISETSGYYTGGALTAAQATSLAAMDLASSKLVTVASKVSVSDASAELLASGNSAAIAAVGKINITDVVSVATLNQVRTAGGTAASEVYTYKLQDSVGALIGAGQLTVGNATSVKVTGSVSVADMGTIETNAAAGTVATTTGYAQVSDTATNLFGTLTGTTLNATVASKADVIALTSGVTIVQANALLADSNFTKSYSIVDTAANLVSAINVDSGIAVLNAAGTVGLLSGQTANAAQATMINANLGNEAKFALADIAANLNLAANASAVANAGSVIVNTSDTNDGLSAGITASKITYSFGSLANMELDNSGGKLDVINGKAGDVLDLTGIADWDVSGTTLASLVLDTNNSLIAGEYSTVRGFYSVVDGTFTTSASGTDTQLLIGTDASAGADEAIIILGITSMTPNAVAGSDVNTFTFG